MTSQAQAAPAAHRKGPRRPWRAILIFLGPAMLYYLIFTIYPFFASIYYSVMSFTPVAGKLTTTFVGLENYIAIFTKDDIFRTSVRNSSASTALLGSRPSLCPASSWASFSVGCSTMTGDC